MITREKNPLNLEMPFHTLDGFITPAEAFYVRCHFPLPQLKEESWRLTVEGEVKQTCEFSSADLRKFPQETITATMECAGNGRVFLVPKVKGVQWELGAVGNSSWTGIRLRHLLERAGIDAAAREVIFAGADKGTIAEPPRPAGEIHFARSLPISKAMDDVLLAWEMNGQPLTAAHGFPLRAVVPGWYGMASVKWLQRIIVTSAPFQGYFQTIDYAYWARRNSEPFLVPLSEMAPKAQIAQPESNQVLSAGANYLMRGAAWSGEAEISKVEVSFDAGASWRQATLDVNSAKNAWRLWTFQWNDVRAGHYVLLARATDSRGRVQRLERSPDNGTYMIDHCLPIEVDAR